LVWRLPQYYFDIETVPLDEYRSDVGVSFDPAKARIISIQYQRLNGAGGAAARHYGIKRRYLEIATDFERH